MDVRQHGLRCQYARQAVDFRRPSINSASFSPLVAAVTPELSRPLSDDEHNAVNWLDLRQSWWMDSLMMII